MVLDTPPLLAILGDDDRSPPFNQAIEADRLRVLSTANYVETSIIIEVRHGAEGVRDLELFIERAGIELVPVDTSQARIACRAFSRFGKGRHRAGLNFGDLLRLRAGHLAR